MVCSGNQRRTCLTICLAQSLSVYGVCSAAGDSEQRGQERSEMAVPKLFVPRESQPIASQLTNVIPILQCNDLNQTLEVYSAN
jgi:hypothetical protein